VLKDHLSRLVPAVRRALEETKEQEARRAWEKRLHQARRLQAASTLAGGVAHDVNKLFMKIREHADLLAREGEHSESTLEIVEKLRDTANEGSGLMQQLLAFARKSEAHLTRIDLPRYLHEEKATLDLLLPKGMELRMQLEEDLPLLFADPEHLHRILVNLVLNARDAMPRGGQIALSAELVQFNPIPEHFMELEDVPYICLKIADAGVGMDEATRHRVFEPFFTTKPVGEGTGLGLPEVFGLMRIHNGLVDIHSEPGKGTAVSLFFPLPRNSYSAPRQIKQLPPISVPEVAAPL
jgi:signal transduction histidine kinase